MSKHSAIEIERAVLGLFLSSEKDFNNSRGIIKPEDFYDERHKIIMQTLNNLVQKDITPEIVAVVNELKDSKNLAKAGGDSYIFELIKSSGLESNLIKYLKLISDKSQIRKVKNVIKKLSRDLESDNANAEELVVKVENAILATTRDSIMKDFESSKVVVERSFSNIQKRAMGEGISGIETSFAEFDEMTGGLQKGDLIIVAARPSMGKTAFALNIAANVAKKNKVAFFSLEMPSEQLINRILSSESTINANKLRESSRLTQSDWKRLSFAKTKVSNLNLFVDDSAGLTLPELIWKSKKLHKNTNINAIVIDYMQLIASKRGLSSDNRQQEVSAISRGLKQLARELEIPVIALSQLSRKVEQREDKRPMMSDLRESGAIEQDADIITFLYRESYYKKEAQKEEMQGADLIIAKHRNGATGTIELVFKPSVGLFADKPKGLEE